MNKILIIEDDRELSEQLAGALRDKGYQVEQSYDGESGLVKASSNQYQLILLDVMLPIRDGFSLLKILRKNSQTPVIIVSAKGAEQEKIAGFSQGADDYVAKPFSTPELLLRIEAVLRRLAPVENDVIEHEIIIENLILNAKSNSVSYAEQALEFTPIQFKLLWELLMHQGEVLSKPYLYQRVLNRNIGAYDRSLDMHLSRVRKKLNEVNGPGERLITSHGQGYSFV